MSFPYDKIILIILITQKQIGIVVLVADTVNRAGLSASVSAQTGALRCHIMTALIAPNRSADVTDVVTVLRNSPDGHTHP